MLLGFVMQSFTSTFELSSILNNQTPRNIQNMAADDESKDSQSPTAVPHIPKKNAKGIILGPDGKP